jgi:hypothetical protein
MPNREPGVGVVAGAGVSRSHPLSVAGRDNTTDRRRHTRFVGILRYQRYHYSTPPPPRTTRFDSTVHPPAQSEHRLS